MWFPSGRFRGCWTKGPPGTARHSGANSRQIGCSRRRFLRVKRLRDRSKRHCARVTVIVALFVTPLRLADTVPVPPPELHGATISKTHLSGRPGSNCPRAPVPAISSRDEEIHGTGRCYLDVDAAGGRGSIQYDVAPEEFPAFNVWGIETLVGPNGSTARVAVTLAAAYVS